MSFPVDGAYDHYFFRWYPAGHLGLTAVTFFVSVPLAHVMVVLPMYLPALLNNSLVIGVPGAV